jgi:hypothetical protein
MYPLLKYFSFTSFIFILIVAIVLALLFNRQSTKSLESFGERSNVVLTQTVSNAVWPHFKSFVAEASQLDQEALRKHPKIVETHERVLKQVSNTPILKVKIFNLSGKTLYSTDASQIGLQKPSSYPGTTAAITGKVISKLSEREKFQGIDKVYYDRQLVSSYLPIRDSDIRGEGIAGVMEIYFDVTEQFAEIREQQYASFGFIVLLLMLLYVSLYLIVRRADRIMFLQALNLKTTLTKLEEKTDAVSRQSRFV